MNFLLEEVSCFLVFFPLLCRTSHPNTQILTNKYGFIPLCSDYQNTAVTRKTDGVKITIPGTRTSQIVYSNPTEEFILSKKENQKLGCAEEHSKLRRLTWQFYGLEWAKTQPRNFSDSLVNGTDKPHNISYFTSAGVYYDSLTTIYYQPDGDYCVHSYSDVDIVLKICPFGEVSPKKNSAMTPWMIPKCCGVNEYLLYWKFSCTPLTESKGMTPWKPPLYNFDDKHAPQKVSTNQYDIRFKMAKMRINCTVSSPAAFKWWNGATVKHPITGVKGLKDDVKLVTPFFSDPSREVQLLVLSPKRVWIHFKTEAFCVDSFYVKTPTQPYTGVPDNFVIYYCSDPLSEDFFSEDGTAVARSSVYVGISMASLLFLLATVLMYGALWKKHNLHGFTIFNYTLASFLSYLFLTVAHIVRLHPEPTTLGLFDRGWFCYGIAIFAHWFFLAGYTWLTVMNVDLYLTFKTVRPVRGDVQDNKNIIYYSLVAWGIPLLLVSAFVAVDEIYRDPLTLVPVPNYATTTCFVSPQFRGEYVYIPMAIMLLTNFMLIGMTMWIFIRAKRQSSKTLAGATTNANHYSAKLFGKLFLVMGGTSMVDFLTWYYDDKGHHPWIIVVLESIAYLTPVFLFILFCLNDRMIGLMHETYPGVTQKLDPILRIFDGRRRAEKSVASNASNVSKQTNTSTLSDGGNELSPLRDFRRK